MSSKDSLGDRMKEYEDAWRISLPIRMPTILRVDGKAFHTLTRKCEKPFDRRLMDCMDDTALALCKGIQGAQIAYLQSDEISVLIHDYKRFDSESWFDKNIQKMVSISAAIASTEFSHRWNYTKDDFDDNIENDDRVCFDSRVFILPEREVNNYFLWRQQDASRNSIQMVCRSIFSHKEMNNKKIPDMHEMLHKKKLNWNDYPTEQKRGRCIVKTKNGWTIDREIPIFNEQPSYIEKFLKMEQE
jgi:tRNA(His) 5'-end guanylyltransferase